MEKTCYAFLFIMFDWANTVESIMVSYSCFWCFNYKREKNKNIVLFVGFVIKTREGLIKDHTM